MSRFVTRSGKQVVYKPRDPGLGVQFGKLIAWCEAQGMPAAIKLPYQLIRLEYTWVEFIKPRPCATVEEHSAFFYNLGAMLALLHGTATVDIHCETLSDMARIPLSSIWNAFISNIDLPPIKSVTDASGLASRSVMSVGILPASDPAGDTNQVFDISVIGAKGDLEAPYKVPMVDNFGRDDIRINYDSGLISSAHSRSEDGKTGP